jgi:pre-rRNA-processing protein TSR3
MATAYPRVSKLFDDPPEGLASIEALSVAFAILGSDPRPLLATYRWGEVFLRENSALFGRWIDPSARRGLPPGPRNEI